MALKAGRVGVRNDQVDLEGRIISGGSGTSEVISVNGKKGRVVLSASDVGALPSDTEIPTSLSQLSDDTTHRTVTDTDISNWNEKVSEGDLALVATSGLYSDLEGTPTIDTELSDTSTNAVQNKVIKEALDTLGESVSNGKSTVAAAITAKGVATEGTDSFDTMATNISNIPSGGGIEKTLLWSNIYTSNSFSAKNINNESFNSFSYFIIKYKFSTSSEDTDYYYAYFDTKDNNSRYFGAANVNREIARGGEGEGRVYIGNCYQPGLNLNFNTNIIPLEIYGLSSNPFES